MLKKITLSILLGISCFANSIQNNNQSSENNDLQKAIYLSKNPITQEKAAEILWRLSIEDGNTKAMTHLGTLFMYGQGVKKDCRKGFWLYTNALHGSEENPPDYEALKQIAYMFARGLCVKKDLKKYQKYMERYEKLIKHKKKKKD